MLAGRLSKNQQNMKLCSPYLVVQRSSSLCQLSRGLHSPYQKAKDLVLLLYLYSFTRLYMEYGLCRPHIHHTECLPHLCPLEHMHMRGLRSEESEDTEIADETE